MNEAAAAAARRRRRRRGDKVKGEISSSIEQQHQEVRC